MKLQAIPTVGMQIKVTLTENEARALDALAGYGDEAFLEHFYKMGTHYLKPHEDGIKTLFAGIREILPQHLHAAEEARRVFADNTYGKGKLNHGQLNGVMDDFLTKDKVPDGK